MIVRRRSSIARNRPAPDIRSARPVSRRFRAGGAGHEPARTSRGESDIEPRPTPATDSWRDPTFGPQDSRRSRGIGSSDLAGDPAADLEAILAGSTGSPWTRTPERPNPKRVRRGEPEPTIPDAELPSDPRGGVDG